MNFIRQSPVPPLDRYVECFWWSRREAPEPHSEYMLPSGRAQLVFALHDTPFLCRSVASGDWTRWRGSMVHGPQSGFYVAGPKPSGVSMGISFRPGAAGAVLGVSMEELTDRHVELDALWGSRAADLRCRLMSAVDAAEAFRILQQSLLARIHRPLLMHPAIGQALAAGSNSSPAIAELQRASGYSPKHFIDLFRFSVGIPPKHYYRIRRFNSVAIAMAAGNRKGLSDLAADAGYSDQAHLTREFKEFAGVTPGHYRPSAGDRPLHHRVALGPAVLGK
jgi:AraC-like DNA-binding protein